jgi:uncharacterized membrane protein
MIWVYAGILLFALPHLFSLLFRGGKDSLKARFGEGPYKGVYSLLSFLGLAALAYGYYVARTDPSSADLAYEPLAAARHPMMLMVLIGFILIFANQSEGYLRAWLKHPFSIGVSLWSIGHLLVNGEKAVVAIFGLFLVLSLADIVLGFARGRGPVHRPNWRHDLRAVVVGVVLFLVFAFGFHPYVLKIPVIG